MEPQKIAMLGIAGGVGPEATNKFCEMIIKKKKKKRDQDNIPFIHYCNPNVPDRTDFILGFGENPVPELVRTCHALESMGAKLLVIPCNTAHAFFDSIQSQVSTPIVNIVDLLIDLGGNKTQHLKLLVPSYGTIEEGQQGAGHKAWTFIDEIIIE